MRAAGSYRRIRRLRHTHTRNALPVAARGRGGSHWRSCNPFFPAEHRSATDPHRRAAQVGNEMPDSRWWVPEHCFIRPTTTIPPRRTIREMKTRFEKLDGDEGRSRKRLCFVDTNKRVVEHVRD